MAFRIPILQKILISLSILVFFSLCLNAYLWSDDFWFVDKFNELSLHTMIIEQYLTWDGRAITVPYVISRYLLLNHLPPELIVFFSTFFFFLTALFNAKIIFNRVSATQLLVVSMIIAISLWFIYRPHLSRSMYWPNATMYTIANFFVFWFAYTIVRKPDYPKWLLWLIIFVAASGGANTASAVWALFFGYLILYRDQFNWKSFFFTFSALVLGSIPVVFAPGNFARASSGGGAGLSLAGNDIMGNFFIVFEEYLGMSKPLLILSPVIAILMICFMKQANENQRRPDFLRLAAIFIVAGLASIAPFTLIPESASKHTSLHFQTFWFIGFCFLFYYVFYNLKPPNIKLINGIVSLLFVSFVTIGIQQFILGRSVKKQAEYRLKLLESARGNTSDTLYLPPIAMSPKLFTNRIWDLSDDPEHEFNAIYKRIFNTGPIIVKDK